MFLIGILGTTFIITSLGFYFLHIYYLIKGKHIQGRVIAIEKYHSSSMPSHDQMEQTYYRPIYEYYFNSQKIWFVGAGSNIIEQKIGETIEIGVLPKGPEFCYPINKLYLVIASLFLIFGAIAIGVSWREYSTWDFKVAPILLTLIVFLVTILSLKRKGILQIIIDGLAKQSQLETIETLKGRDVYWNNTEINNIKKRHTRMAVIVSSIFLLISASLTVFLWSKIPRELTEISFQQIIEQPEFVGFLISFAFTLISLGGYVSSLSKR